VTTPEETLTVAPLRPGCVRRMAAGAWHLPAGALFLLRHASLWPVAALPALVGMVTLLLGAALALLGLGAIEQAMAPLYAHLPHDLSFALALTLWTATLVTGTVAGLGVGILLTAPLLDHLSLRTEVLLRGSATNRTPGRRWEVWRPLRTSLLLVGGTPLSLALGVLPLIGLPLQLAWIAQVLATQQSEGPLTRCGLDPVARQQWRREWRWECLGFGMAGFLAILVPFVVIPSLATGMACLVLEIEGLVAETPAQPVVAAGAAH
jgi:uncharacterized protein involved in cysteine biosynthesis